jgi:hypothetical protein
LIFRAEKINTIIKEMNDMNDTVYKDTILDVKVTTKKHDTNVKDSNIWKNREEYAH